MNKQYPINLGLRIVAVNSSQIKLCVTNWFHLSFESRMVQKHPTVRHVCPKLRDVCFSKLKLKLMKINVHLKILFLHRMILCRQIHLMTKRIQIIFVR
ncbi:unnamed protein product [Schistosoma mattheei]|uniref:Uncharacterized protein n=1 Tax=Schistosoma mattheei TaxID=31246 RepID=A0A183NNC3_9TREM|nr:unnamed protein product [Schistosoma mattheei]